MAGNFDFFGLAETHTNTWQCSKVAAKLHAEGFRVWSIAATEHRDIRGRTNYSGGIIAAVRANRKGFHFDELQGEDDPLIILYLQHCILGFAWARNGLTADSELAQCSFDAQCLQHIQNIPWVMVGDWNLLPHQNPLLDPGTALVAATDEFGELLPTLWSSLDSTENMRCMDYLLAERNLDFEVDSYKCSDHKIVSCTWQCFSAFVRLLV